MRIIFYAAIGSIMLKASDFIGRNASSISLERRPVISKSNKSVTYTINWGVPYQNVEFQDHQFGLDVVKS